MICPKCGKKVEYILPTCKYCDEPIVLEGVLPLGDIADKSAGTVSIPVQDNSFVAGEAYAYNGAVSAPVAKEIKSEMWKYIVAACICAVIVLGSVFLILNITQKDDKRISKNKKTGKETNPSASAEKTIDVKKEDEKKTVGSENESQKSTTELREELIKDIVDKYFPEINEKTIQERIYSLAETVNKKLKD